MFDSVRPHRRQPTRLPRPWNSPGKNTGVGCHFLLQCMKVKSEKWKLSCSVVSDPQQPHGLQPSRLLHPWDFPGKTTGVGCHCLLQCFLPREVLLALFIKLVWCCWILLTFACLEGFWFLCQIWTGVLPGRVVLVEGSSLSSLYIVPFPSGL